MPILNIPVKEWGADMADQAKRKAEEAMRQIKDDGGAAIAETQRKAQEARDTWMREQIEAAMAPIREAGHTAAEGLSALGGLKNDLGAGLQQSVAAQEAMDQTSQQTAEREAAQPAQVTPPPTPEAPQVTSEPAPPEISAPTPPFRIPGADGIGQKFSDLGTNLRGSDDQNRLLDESLGKQTGSVMGLNTYEGPEKAPIDTNASLPERVIRNQVNQTIESGQRLDDPEEWKKTGAAALEIAPEVASPYVTGWGLATDQKKRERFMQKDLPAAAQVLQTVGDVGNVIPLPGEQLENTLATAALEATRDLNLPEPVKAGIALAAGSGVPTKLAQRAFKVPGGVSSRVDEAGRAAMGDGKLGILPHAGAGVPSEPGYQHLPMSASTIENLDDPTTPYNSISRGVPLHKEAALAAADTMPAEHGDRGAVLRVRDEPGLTEENIMSGGTRASRPLQKSELEVYGDDGQWHPLEGFTQRPDYGIPSAEQMGGTPPQGEGGPLFPGAPPHGPEGPPIPTDQAGIGRPDARRAVAQDMGQDVSHFSDDDLRRMSTEEWSEALDQAPPLQSAPPEDVGHVLDTARRVIDETPLPGEGQQISETAEDILNRPTARDPSAPEPDPTKGWPEMHRMGLEEHHPGRQIEERRVWETQYMLNFGAARKQQLRDAGLNAEYGDYQLGMMPPGEWERIKPPGADDRAAWSEARRMTEETMGPEDPRTAFPAPHGGASRPPGPEDVPEGALPYSRGKPPGFPRSKFPDPHGAGERGPGEVDMRRLDNPYWEGDLDAAFTPEEDRLIDQAIQRGEIGGGDPTNREVMLWAQENLPDLEALKETRLPDNGDGPYIKENDPAYQMDPDYVDYDTPVDEGPGPLRGTRPIEPTDINPTTNEGRTRELGEFPPDLPELGPERLNFRVPGTSGMSVADQVAGRALGAVQGGIAGDRQDENDEGWERLARIGGMAALGAAAPPQNVKAASLAKGLLRNADRIGQQADELGVRAGAVEYPGRRLNQEAVGQTPPTHLEAMPEGEPIPVFYSKLRRQIDTLPNRATTQQIRAHLLKAGVKPDEMKWSGMDDYLDQTEAAAGPGAVHNKAVVQRIMDDRMVQLRESVRERPFSSPEQIEEGRRLEAAKRAADAELTRASEESRRAWEAVPRRPGQRRAVTAQDPAYRVAAQAHNDALDAREAADAAYYQHRRQMEGTQATKPKFEEYSQGLKAGVENEQSVVGANDVVNRLDTVIDARPGYREIVLNVDTPGNRPDFDYKDPHFTGEKNTPLHARVTDRTLPDGRKVLHIEEMQSQWHQDAMKPLRDSEGNPVIGADGKPVRMGYRQDPEVAWARQEKLSREADDLVSREGEGVLEGWAGTDPERRMIRARKLRNAQEGRLEAIREEIAQLDPERRANIDPDFPHYERVQELRMQWEDLRDLKDRNQEELFEAQQEVANLTSDVGRPPMGPWSKSWNELGMKRLLRMASEEGYDAISWTPAKVHQQRYGQLIPERYTKLEYDRANSTLFAYGRRGDIRELGEVTPQKLPDYIGPELTQRLLAEEPMTTVRAVDGVQVREQRHTLRGRDLVVTTPGSKGFVTQYEKVMPQTADALGKPWGQKSRLGEIELTPGGERSDAYIMDLTPEMKKGITEEGFPLFIRDQQGAGTSGMAMADQIAGRAVGAVQGGIAGDRQDEDDTGWERAARIGGMAALGAAAKPANVNLASLARGAVRNADKLDDVLGAVEGEAPRRGRPPKYTPEMRTPPSRPPVDYSGDLLAPDAYPQTLVAEEVLQIEKIAARKINDLRDMAKGLPQGPERNAIEAAAKNYQDTFIGRLKGRLTPEERARYDVEHSLERQGKPRPGSRAVPSGNSGADVLPETPPSSQVDDEVVPTGPSGEGAPPPPARPRPSTTQDAGDLTDEGVTVTETPEEALSRQRQRERELAAQEGVDTEGGTLPDERPADRPPQQDMARAEEQSKRPLPVTPEEEEAEAAARAARATESGSNNEVELGELGRALENEAAVTRGPRPKDAGPHMGDWLESIRYGWGLLANPATAAADAVAGAAEIPWTRIRNRLLDVTDPNRKLVREAATRGYKEGGAEGRRRAGEIMRTGKELKELMPGAAAEDTPRSLMRRYQERGQKNWALAAGTAEFASRGRNALDALSHGSLYLGQLYREAAKSVNKTSLPKGSDQWWEAVERFVDVAEDAKTPETALEFLARKKAMDQADRALGRNDPGYVGTHIGNTLKHPVLRQFLPLFRTGYNITMRGLERSPIGAGAILVDKVMGKPISAEQVMDSAMGSAIMLPMAAYAIQSGNITGAGPEDQRTREDLEKEGWKPFSIRTPDGVYRSYTRFGTAAAPMAMAGAISDASRYHEVDEHPSKRIMHAAGNFGKWMTGQFVLRSLGNISDVFTDPVKEAPAYLGRMAGQYAGIGSLTGGIASAMDPYQRDTASGGPDTPLPEWGQPFVNEIVKNIPGARQSLDPLYDEFGTEKPNPGAGLRGFVNPYTAGPSPDELDYRHRDLRRYRGSESAAEDARIAESIEQWKDEIGRKRGPLGEEASSLAGRFLGSDNPDYLISRAEAQAAEDMRANERALARLGG